MNHPSSWIPDHVRQQILDSAVAFLSEKATDFIGEQASEVLGNLKSDAKFQRQFNESLHRATESEAQATANSERHELRQKVNVLEDQIIRIPNVQTTIDHQHQLVDSLIAHTGMHPSDKGRQKPPQKS